MSQFRWVKPRRPLRRQKPVKGGRHYVSAALISEIEEAIQADMKRFGVARSFVIAVKLADGYGIDEQEDYRRDRETVVRKKRAS